MNRGSDEGESKRGELIRECLLLHCICIFPMDVSEFGEPSKITCLFMCDWCVCVSFRANVGTKEPSYILYPSMDSKLQYPHPLTPKHTLEMGQKSSQFM